MMQPMPSMFVLQRRPFGHAIRIALAAACAALLGCGDDEPSGPRIWDCHCTSTIQDGTYSFDAELCRDEKPTMLTGRAARTNVVTTATCECEATSVSCMPDGGPG